MLNDKIIMAFLATADPAIARPFYEGILGLPLKRTDPYAMVFDSNGIELRMTTVKDFKPVPYSVLSWVVPDIQETIAQLQSKGVYFEKYSFFDQDADGVWKAPDGTKVAWFKDPDENILSITQFNS